VKVEVGPIPNYFWRFGSLEISGANPSCIFEFFYFTESFHSNPEESYHKKIF
jgi:hypothetical protein